MLVYAIGCNLRCYGCFNYETLIANPKHTCDEQYILNHIKNNGYLFDSIIYSGGEFFIHSILNIEKLLTKTRSLFDGKIIVNTNGLFPKKVKYVLENDLVDGIHLDLKLPIETNDDLDVKLDVLGSNIDLKLVYETANIVSKNNSNHSRFRTVKYPILSDEYFNMIEKNVNEINKKNNSKIKWSLNNFINE